MQKTSFTEFVKFDDDDFAVFKCTEPPPVYLLPVNLGCDAFNHGSSMDEWIIKAFEFHCPY